jgi:membrane protease YdiL (CAAX protease family)
MTDEAGQRRRALIEALVMFAVSTLICSVLWQLGRVSGFIRDNLPGFIAAVFLYLPTALLIKRKEDFAPYGLTHHPLGRGMLYFLVTSLVVFPLFAVGFFLFYQIVCAAGRSGYWIPRPMRHLCHSYAGSLSQVRWRVPPNFLQIVLGQLIVVGLAEEYFFRGYLQTRLEQVWPSRHSLLGGSVGPSVVAAAALFSLGHLLVDFNALRLAVFFPGLVFGWLRQATGSILAGVLFHGCSNLVSMVLHASFF